jgi:SET domain-containing protein
MSHRNRVAVRFRRGLVQVGDSPIHGKGVFASRAIAAGSYIGTFRGPAAWRNGTYVLWVWLDDGRAVGRRGRNHFRYLNHAPSANAEFDGFDLYAVRDIPAGVEITIDYGPDYAPESA